ncbi:MAG: dUTP diphosphatase [Saprospiraceae bacterium]|nr:dUTP diphosphatase [Saprospiraceae bacterium]
MVVTWKGINDAINAVYANNSQYPADAGFDLMAYMETNVVIGVGEQAMFSTGVNFSFSEECVGLILPRSSMNKRGIISRIGVIDSGYVNEQCGIAVMLQNQGDVTVKIHPLDKIAQLVVVPRFRFINGNVAAGERGSNGFGSTGR